MRVGHFSTRYATTNGSRLQFRRRIVDRCHIHHLRNYSLNLRIAQSPDSHLDVVSRPTHAPIVRFFITWFGECTVSSTISLKFDPKVSMKLLNTYEDRDDAEEAAEKLNGDKRMASERDATVVIYNLFGIPSWGNFHRLKMHNIQELGALLSRRAEWSLADQKRHSDIIASLQIVAKNYEISIPPHWL